MSRDDTTRRSVLRGIAATAAVGGVAGPASATVSDGPVSVRQVERPVENPASLLERDAGATLATLVERGLLSDGVSDLRLEPRAADEVLSGTDGVAAFGLEPRSGGRELRYLVASRTTEAGQLRVWLDRLTSHSYATLATDDGWRRVAADDTVGDVERQALCSDFCDDAACDGRGRYYEVEETLGQCEIVNSFCGC